MIPRYWDSATFLAWLQEEAGRVDRCRAVITEAQAGRVKIVTSALTIAEVLMYRGSAPIPHEDREKIRKFFEHEWIAVRDVDRRVAEPAQDLVWEHSIRPKDAIHVATALDAAVAQLDTFDDALIQKSKTVGTPPLVIGHPEVPGTLFSIPDE